ANYSSSFHSALRDRRFPPIQAKELPFLECTVSILTDYEPALDYLDWEVCHLTFLKISFLSTFCWTKAETIDSLMRKAGYNGAISESLRNRLHITRYQSTLYTMHYRDYASYVEMTRGVSPIMNGAKPVH
ncbi:hypothetical protein BHE74_00027571, partial [Ensete ventricosum]